MNIQSFVGAMSLALVASVSPLSAEAAPCGTPVECYERAIDLVKKNDHVIDRLREELGKTSARVRDLESHVSDLEKVLKKIEGRTMEGAIVAFNLTTCPNEEGWFPYEKLESRLIIGASADYLRGKNYGGKSVTLNEKNLPEHKHVIEYKLNKDVSGTSNGYTRPEFNDEKGDRRQYSTSADEKRVPDAFSIIPPVHALIFCIKQK